MLCLGIWTYVGQPGEVVQVVCRDGVWVFDYPVAKISVNIATLDAGMTDAMLVSAGHFRPPMPPKVSVPASERRLLINLTERQLIPPSPSGPDPAVWGWVGQWLFLLQRVLQLFL